MRISHKFKYIYISIPKTASSAIREALNPVCDVSSDYYPPDKDLAYRKHKYANLYDEEFQPHLTFLEIKQKFEERGWDFDSYKKFSFVRNPWDREVSHYEYKKNFVYKYYQRKEGKYRFDIDEKYANECEQVLSKSKDFTGFITECYMMECCSTWLQDERGNLAVDYVGKMENIEEDFRNICVQLGIENKTDSLHTTGLSGRRETRDDRLEIDKSGIWDAGYKNYKHYTEYYTEETKNILSERYERDIREFSYKF
jgi:hypothetical protein